MCNKDSAGRQPAQSFWVVLARLRSIRRVVFSSTAVLRWDSCAGGKSRWEDFLPPVVRACRRDTSLGVEFILGVCVVRWLG